MFTFFLTHFQRALKRIGVGITLTVLTVLVSGNISFYPVAAQTATTSAFRNEPVARMFLIMVIDSNDEIIGQRCVTDMDQMIYGFRELADWLFMEMEEPKIISGDAFSKEAVNEAIDHWLRSQDPTRNDIVVFYYSGHGFSYSDDASDYPRMWLKTKTDTSTQTASLRMEEDIYNRIVTMGAGFNFVLSDCCNTAVAGDNAAFDHANVPARKRVAHKRNMPTEVDLEDDLYNAEKLFTPEQPFSLLATAAGKGELAGGKAETGGFFTNFLLQALEECVYDAKMEASWQSIFRFINDHAGYWAKSAACPQARRNEQGRCIQEAKFKIDIPD